jgi:glutaredoxin
MSKVSKILDAQAKSSSMRKIVTGALIVAAFAAVIYLGLRKRGNRLDGFAKCLAAKQVKMYGAYWCPHCAEQKEMFESSFQYVPYVECGIPGSREEAPACKEAGIKHFPTWQFGDAERREGTQPLPALGTKTGCSLP